MNNNKALQAIAKSQYKSFLAKEGSDYIAADYALYSLLRIIRDFKITSILETGIGIGCIVHTVLKYRDINKLNISYVGTEANEFCLSAIGENLKEFKNDFTLLKELKDVSDKQKFQLVIVDGQDASLKSIAKFIDTNGLIFIEGGRADQVKSLLETFPNSISTFMVTSKPNQKNSIEFTEDTWRGGGTLIFVNPTLQQKIYRFKEKAASSIKVRILRKLSKN